MVILGGPIRVLVVSRLTFSRPIHFRDLTCSRPTLSLPVLFRYLTFSLPVLFATRNNRYMKKVMLIFILSKNIYNIHLKIFTKYAYKGTIYTIHGDY